MATDFHQTTTRRALDGDTANAPRWLLAAAAMLLAALACTSVDVPVALAAREGAAPGDIRKIADLAEVFGHGSGVALVLATVWVLDRAGRRHLWRLIACAYGAGLLANVLKLLIPRMRPRAVDLSAVESVWGTFAVEGGMWESARQSLPSGHTATAFGLALGLSAIYPHGRWWFLTLASLAGAQRVLAGAHYPSDVATGVAVAMLVAGCVLTPGLLGGWFDRLEARDR